MPRFTVKDLLIATTLISLGAGLWVVMTNNPHLFSINRERYVLFLLIWFGGGAIIGAGLLTPFTRIWAGAFAGVAASLAWLIFALVY